MTSFETTLATVPARSPLALARTHALAVIGGNTGNAPTSLAAAARRGEVASATYKRGACLTTECVSCPYQRDNGSC